MAADIAESYDQYAFAVAQIVETNWVEKACEALDRPLPGVDEEEPQDFSIKVADIFVNIEELIEAVELRFS